MKLTQFPIQTETGLMWSSREDYLSINLGKWNKQYGDIFTRRKLIDMLSMVEGNFKCSPQEEESVQSVWREMQEDIELAKNPPCEVVEAEAVVEPVQEPMEASDAEFELVERAVGDFVIAKSFSSFHQKFDLGPKMLSVTPKSDASNDDLIDALAFQLMNNTASEWAIGKLVNLLVDRGVENVVIQICGQLNRNYQTISRWARTEKNIPVELRDPRLTISAYSEIGCARFDKDPEVQKAKVKELCETALSEGWGVAESRAAVRTAQGKKLEESPAPTPPVALNKLGRYIVVYRGQDCQNSYSCDQLPDPDEEHVVVDTLDSLISCHLCGGTPSWIPLPKEVLEQTALTPEVEGV